MIKRLYRSLKRKVEKIKMKPNIPELPKTIEELSELARKKFKTLFSDDITKSFIVADLDAEMTVNLKKRNLVVKSFKKGG